MMADEATAALPTAPWGSDLNVGEPEEAVTQVVDRRSPEANMAARRKVSNLVRALHRTDNNSQVIREPESWAQLVLLHLQRSGEPVVELVGEPPTLDDSDLADSLADLETLQEEADQQALENARLLLPRMHEILAERYAVYVSDRSGVVIEAPMRDGASVGVECGKNDVVYCFASIRGNNRRAKFYQMDGLPDVFIEKALRDLGNAAR